jgi:NAD-dependent DNA ligase
MKLQDRAEAIISKNKNMMVPYYLMAAYSYYKQDDPIFSDAYFDELAKRMLDCWNEIEHYHKHLITTIDLSAGTYLGEYPSIIEGALNDFKKSS